MGQGVRVLALPGDPGGLQHVADDLYLSGPSTEIMGRDSEAPVRHFSVAFSKNVKNLILGTS